MGGYAGRSALSVRVVNDKVFDRTRRAAGDEVSSIPRTRKPEEHLGATMRFMWSGYGYGSRSGLDEAKQYKTLRGKSDILKGTIRASLGGVTSGGKSQPSITIDGVTTKRSGEYYNNDMSLIFWDMSGDEALLAAAQFIKFAAMINGREGKGALLDDGAKVLFDPLPGIVPMSPRDHFSDFLGEVANRWERDAEANERVVAAFTDAARAHGVGLADKSAFTQTAKWRRRCAAAMRNFLNYYRSGDDVEKSTGDGPTVVK
ncbi:hypothetical protein N181_01905 [Sinorhizobium fredii USDA 205]|uniref:Uncharacterized protein n=1 Tax=Rhizobium fredii TaxID=380 RepID=A0A844AIJ7_RHIFR|nr:hypothetical protein [Sinorhizobium fredii]KSV87379.1 hypothetical protein N181_01905 [Sinorhizobium fredii USDA 205]MQX11778.1 hypothetical protein [Sinorhizobium fredii]